MDELGGKIIAVVVGSVVIFLLQSFGVHKLVASIFGGSSSAITEKYLEPPASNGNRSNTEDNYWSYVVKCGNDDCYRAYLDKYPDGEYEKLARAQLSRNENNKNNTFYADNSGTHSSTSKGMPLDDSSFFINELTGFIIDDDTYKRTYLANIRDCVLTYQTKSIKKASASEHATNSYVQKYTIPLAKLDISTVKPYGGYKALDAIGAKAENKQKVIEFYISFKGTTEYWNWFQLQTTSPTAAQRLVPVLKKLISECKKSL